MTSNYALERVREEFERARNTARSTRTLERSQDMRAIPTLLLLACIASCDSPREVKNETYSGYYNFGFEVMDFYPDGVERDLGSAIGTAYGLPNKTAEFGVASACLRQMARHTRPPSF